MSDNHPFRLPKPMATEVFKELKTLSEQHAMSFEPRSVGRLLNRLDAMTRRPGYSGVDVSELFDKARNVAEARHLNDPDLFVPAEARQFSADDFDL